jgi:hypothetical protein
MNLCRYTGLRIGLFSNITSLELIPAPDEKTWNVLPDDFLAQIKNLSVEVVGYSYVPYAQLKNLLALRWGASGGRRGTPKAAHVFQNMEHVRQLQSLFLTDSSSNAVVFEAVTRHKLPLKHLEFCVGSGFGKGAVPVLKRLDYFGVSFSSRVGMTKEIVQMVSHVHCFHLRSYKKGFSWCAFEILQKAAKEAGGTVVMSPPGREEETMEFSRGPPFTRKYYVGEFPFLPW